MKQNSDQTVQNNQFSDQLLSIPTKICDGVFMADELISQDVQWLQMNQVTHIINCAGKHCKNTNRINGVNFLTYEWSQNNIQNIIEQNVIGAAISFIQQAKKQCGSVLVHCYQSESRPFCILASYLMIRYQWNLFKTLEFLNSRKQDIQLQPAFFQQLTSLHQKLQQKGLIKSRTWNRQEQMSDEELILTNTFLNSRKRAQQNANVSGKQAKTKKNEAKGKKVLWKESTSEIYVYYPLTPLIQLNPKINSKQNQKTLKDATQTTQCQSRYTEEDSNSFKIQQTQSQQPKQTAKQSKAITQVNVTKRWAELRQSWTKEKQNNQQLQNQPQPKVICTYYYNSENSRKVEKPLSSFNQPRQQKISDRIQDKLNIIRNGYEVKSASNDIMKRRDHTPITGKKIKSNTQNSVSVKRQGQATQRVSLIQKKKTQEDHEMSSGENSKDNERQPFYEFNRNSSTVNSKNTSKIMKNNFAKANFGMNDSRATNEAVNQSNPVTNASMIISQVKQMGNKSVLIVKPNQFGQNMSSDSVSRQARNSKRKISDNDKQNRFSLNKDTSLMRQTSGNEPMRNSKVSNFFRVDNQQSGNMKNQSQNERMAKRIENNGIYGSRVSDSLQTNKTSSSLTKKASSSTSVMTKMRSSSTRVSRKQDVGVSNLSISKNYSYTGKGKWKF